MKGFPQRAVNNEFLRFLLAGGIAAGVNFFSRILLNQILSFTSSIVLAYLIGMLTAFAICKFCVFSAGKSLRTGKELIGFTLVNVAAVLQTLAVTLLLAERVLPALGIELYRKEFSHFVGISVPIFTSYIGHKYISFGNRQEKVCD